MSPTEEAGIVVAIGITSSIGNPVARTVFAIARSSVRLEPARYGVPGSETRPSSARSQATSPIVNRRAPAEGSRPPRGSHPAAAIASVIRIDRAGPFARTIALSVDAGRWWSSAIMVAVTLSSESSSQITFG